MRSTRSASRARPGSCRSTRANPASITAVTPGMVSELSAMFVARTTRRRRGDGVGRLEQPEAPPPVQAAAEPAGSTRTHLGEGAMRDCRRAHVEASECNGVRVGPRAQRADDGKHRRSLTRTGRDHRSADRDRSDQPSWTQTGVSIGITPLSQIQSIAGTLTRTQPCDAG
mgnify:CR=1 FL=1